MVEFAKEELEKATAKEELVLECATDSFTDIEEEDEKKYFPEAKLVSEEDPDKEEEELVPEASNDIKEED